MGAINITHALAFGWPGPQEIILILLVLLLLFGGRKLPELARGLGRSMRVFRSEMRGVKDEIDGALSEDDDTPKLAGPGKADKPAARTDTDAKARADTKD